MSGDATWIHTFAPSLTWLTPGGDFVSSASATVSVAGTGDYIWRPTPELIADVQGWLDDPVSNFGWIVIGDEVAEMSLKRFDTREGPASPLLAVGFQPPSVGVEEGPRIGDPASLRSNYPNPFTKTTKIGFEISKPRSVSLDVFDALGRRVTTLVSGFLSSGSNEVSFDASNLSPGVYFYRLHAGDFVETKRMLVTR